MKYSKEDLERLIVIEGRSYEDVGRMYSVTGAAIKKAAVMFGMFFLYIYCGQPR